MRDTSTTHPWDYEASRAGEHVRVEVKGTTGVRGLVQLTAGEVRNALSYPTCALAVVSGIRLDTSTAEPTATGGDLALNWPWKLDEAGLRPLSYEYRLPDQPDAENPPEQADNPESTEQPEDH